jgi:hypothetical protein
MAKKYESIASQVKEMDCGTEVEGMPLRERAALHAHKANFAKDLEKLYKIWGDKAADDYIRPILHKL